MSLNVPTIEELRSQVPAGSVPQGPAMATQPGESLLPGTIEAGGGIGPSTVVPQEDGTAYLVPGMGEDGRVLSAKEARARLEQGGSHYGLFESPQRASEYQQAHTSEDARARIRSALLLARGVSPERVARDNQLARELGVSPMSIRYASEDAEDMSLAGQLEQFRGLQDFASRSPAHAAYVRGDFSQLAAIEQFEKDEAARRLQTAKETGERLEKGGWGGVLRAPNESSARTLEIRAQKSWLQSRQGELARQAVDMYMSGDAAGAEGVRQKLDALNAEIASLNDELGVDDSWAARLGFGYAADQAYTSLPVGIRAATTGMGAYLATAGTAAFLGAGAGGVGALPAAVVAQPEAAIAGAAAYKLSSFAGSYQLERNLALADMLTMKDEAGRQIPMDVAINAATLYGMVAAGVEMIGDAAFLKAIGAPSKAALAGSGAVRESFKAAAVRIAQDPAYRQGLERFIGAVGPKALQLGASAMRLAPRAGGLVKTAVAEGGEEIVQEGSNILAETGAKAKANEQGASFSTELGTQEQRERIAEAAKGGFFGGLWMSAGPVVLSGMAQAVQARDARAFADKAMQRHAVVEQSKLKQLDPQAMSELLQATAPETAQEVSLPMDQAVALYQQGLDVITPLGLSLEEAQKAAALGQALDVPLSDLHARLDQKQFNAASEIFVRKGEASSAADAQTSDEELARALRQTLDSAERMDAARSAESWLSPEQRTEYGAEMGRLREEMREAILASPNLKAQVEALAGVEPYLDAVMGQLRRVASIQARRTGQKPADIARQIAVAHAERSRKMAGKTVEEAVESDIEAEFAERPESVQPAMAAQDAAPVQEEVQPEPVQEEAQAPAESQPVQQAQEPEAPAVPARQVRGRSEALATSTGDEPFSYQVWELSDLIPSHDPTAQFARRADYPAGVQERPYHSDKGEQEKVRRNAGALDPRYLINTNPDAMSGPPVITSAGVVLGGNSRTMSIQVAYSGGQNGRGGAYRQAVIDQAQSFGLDPAAVAGMSQPVLVRVVDRDMSPLEMAQASRRYNEVTTQALQSEAEGVSKSKLVSDRTLASFASDVEEFDTIREFLSSPRSRDFVAGLMDDGVIEPTQASRLTDAETGLLNPEGKNLVVNTLRGLVVQDYDIIRKAPGPVLDKIDRAIPDLVSLRNRGGQWAKAVASIQEAVNQINKWQATGSEAFPHTLANVHLHFDQGALVADPAKSRKAVHALAVTLATASPKEFQARVATMEAEARNAAGKANAMSAMLGAADKPVSPAGAFVRAFLKPVAMVDGKAVRGFDPENSPAHGAIQWASENSGTGHTFEAAQNKLTAIMASRKASKEEKAVAKERLGLISGKSGKVYAYGRPELGAFSYRKSMGDVLWQRMEDSAMDAEYMKAYEAGDIAKMAEMVEARARQLGFADAIPEHSASYTLRTKPAPKQTRKAYKAFYVDASGRPSALFVGGAEALPVGVWLDANDQYHFTGPNGKEYVPSTKNPNRTEMSGKRKNSTTGASVPVPDDPVVRQYLLEHGFITDKAKSVTALAYRPGWHAGTMPFFPQGGKKQAGSNYGMVHEHNQVIFEIEINADRDWTDFARSQDKAKTKAGKVNNRAADLQQMPESGFYTYTTNPILDPKEGAWVITDSIRIVRALTQTECDKILEENGKLPQEWEQGQMRLEDLNLDDQERSDAMRKTLAPVTYDEQGNVVPLSKRFNRNNPSVLYQSGIQNDINAVRKQYENTPEWMKTPNGNPTNLTEEQWLTVRTPEFKSRFGDWEKAGVAKWLMGPSVCSTSGNVVPFLGGKGVADWAGEYYAKAVPSSMVAVPGVGNVRLDRRTAKNSLNHGMSALKVQALALLPEALPKSVLLSTSQKNNSLMTGYIVGVPVSIGEKDCVLIVVIRGDNNGMAMYVHEAIEKDRLRDYIKTAARAEPGELTRSNRGVIRSVVESALTVNEELWGKLDENGEPRAEFIASPRALFQLAWHGSPFRFSKFTLDHIGQGEGSQAHGYGLYFAQDRAVATDYRSMADSGFTYKGRDINELYRQLEKQNEYDRLEVLESFMTELDTETMPWEDFDEEAARWFKTQILPKVKSKGKLYGVDVPENDVLMDEQKGFDEQPESVRQALLAAQKEYGISLEGVGRDFYDGLKASLGSPQAASAWLNERGVKGITYEGQRDGRCFVIWDEDAVQILQTLYQEKQERHGQELAQAPDAFARGVVLNGRDNYFIELFKRADLSTLFHELAHTYFLSMERYVQDGMADAEMKGDYETLCRWLGAAPGEALTEEQHEQLARGWEAYLMEGKAPSVELEGVFARLRRWFLKIYREIAALGVELNDEVRGVFDRMIATQDEIEDAAAQNGLVSLTTGELQAMGVSPVQMAYTRRVLEAAKEKAAERLQLKRDQERKSRLADYRVQAREELMKERVYQARAEMRKTPVDLDAVRALVGEEMASRLMKRQPAAFKKDGEDPGLFAMRQGYASAEEMLADMDRAGSLGEAVKARAAEMDAEFDRQFDGLSELLDTEEIAEHASLVGRHLAKIAGRSYIQQQAVKRVALQEMQGMSVQKAMRIGDFRASLRRALRDERRAVAGRRYAEALEANTKARLNLEMARLSQELREEVQKAERAARRFAASKSIPDVPKYFLARLVRQHGFLAPDFAQALVDKYTDADIVAWQEKLEADGYTMLIDQNILAETTQWRDMTLEQWREFADAMRQVVVVERNQRQLLTARGKKKLEDAAEEIAQSLAANNRAKTNGRAVPDAVRALRKLHVEHMKVEQMCLLMDGGKIGPMWEYVYKPVSDAADAQAVQLKAVRDYMRKELFGMYSGKEFKALGKKAFVASVGRSMTLEERLCVALNLGNEVNAERIKAGFQWSDAQVADVVSVLTARDWEFVQKVWDYLETFREPAFKVHEEITGSRPSAVEAKAFEVQTADGKTLQMRGGYYPIRYDPVENSVQYERDQKAMDQELFGGRNYGAAQTKHGHLKERSSAGLGTPLLLNFTVLSDHLFNVVHDITHRKAVLDAAKVVRNKTVREAVEAYAGREAYLELMPWLQDCANERQAPMSQVQKMASWARASGTIMQMGYKLTTIFMVPSGFTQSISELGWKWSHVGVWHAVKGLAGGWKKTQAMWELTKQKSPMMASRVEAFDRDIRDFSKRLNAGPVSGWIDRVRNFAFIPMGYVQLWTVDMPTWWGAYEKGLHEHQGDEAMAAAYADSVVRLTQASGATKDLARVQRGSDLHRMLTMFYSYFNTLYNLGALHVRALREDHTPSGIFRAANAALLLWFLPSVMSELMAGRAPDDGEDDLEGYLKWAGKIWIQYPFQSIVGVRDVASYTFSEFDYELSPAQSAPASLVKFFRKLDKALEEEDPSLLVKPGAEALGYALKLPMKQPIITVENMWDYCTNPGSEFYLRDLAFTKPKSRRQ